MDHAAEDVAAQLVRAQPLRRRRLRMVVKLVWKGSWLATSGSRASATKNSTMARPSMAM